MLRQPYRHCVVRKETNCDLAKSCACWRNKWLVIWPEVQWSVLLPLLKIDDRCLNVLFRVFPFFLMCAFHARVNRLVSTKRLFWKDDVVCQWKDCFFYHRNDYVETIVLCFVEMIVSKRFFRMSSKRLCRNDYFVFCRNDYIETIISCVIETIVSKRLFRVLSKRLCRNYYFVCHRNDYIEPIISCVIETIISCVSQRSCHIMCQPKQKNRVDGSTDWHASLKC